VAGYIPRWFTGSPTVTHPSTNKTQNEFLVKSNNLTQIIGVGAAKRVQVNRQAVDGQ